MRPSPERVKSFFICNISEYNIPCGWVCDVCGHVCRVSMVIVRVWKPNLGSVVHKTWMRQKYKGPLPAWYSRGQWLCVALDWMRELAESVGSGYPERGSDRDQGMYRPGRTIKGRSSDLQAQRTGWLSETQPWATLVTPYCKTWATPTLMWHTDFYWSKLY